MVIGMAGANPTRWGSWKVVITFIFVLIISISVLLAGLWFLSTSMRLGLWIAVLVLLSAFAIAIGHIIKRRWLGILIDSRNKVSLSRFQISLWLILIISAFFAAGLSNLHITLLSAPVDALSITVPSELLAVLGVSTTSLIGSPFILRVKSHQHKIDTNDNLYEAAWSDMFKGDDDSNSDSVDLSKVQMFYITITLVLVYGAALTTMFIKDTSHAISTLPALSTTIVTFLGISHAGYLGYKAVPHNVSQPPGQGGGSSNQEIDSPDQGSKTVDA